MFKDAIISAFFGALGPFFNKQATTDPNRLIVIKLNEFNMFWGIYFYNVACVALMLTMNTISVKYKMLSYKNDGSFIGTTVIFTLGYMFSSLFDFLIGEPMMPKYRYLGVFMIICGVLLIRCHPNSQEKAGTGQPAKEGAHAQGDVPMSSKKLQQIEIELGLEAVNIDPDRHGQPETQAPSVAQLPKPEIHKMGSASSI